MGVPILRIYPIWTNFQISLPRGGSNPKGGGSNPWDSTDGGSSTYRWSLKLKLSSFGVLMSSPIPESFVSKLLLKVDELAFGHFENLFFYSKNKIDLGKEMDLLFKAGPRRLSNKL